jgi:hypothetical protein
MTPALTRGITDRDPLDSPMISAIRADVGIKVLESTGQRQNPKYTLMHLPQRLPIHEAAGASGRVGS